MMDINEIREYLPHRYPFLLVDRVVELDIEGKRIRAYKNVSINEPFFNGHFPEHPIMPGVLIIEAMAQAAGILGFKMLDVKPADGGVDAVVVTDKLTTKIPEKNRIGSLAFITKDGDLSRTDPSAMPLFTDEDIRTAGGDVDYRTGEIKEAPGA